MPFLLVMGRGMEPAPTEASTYGDQTVGLRASNLILSRNQIIRHDNLSCQHVFSFSWPSPAGWRTRFSRREKPLEEGDCFGAVRHMK